MQGKQADLRLRQGRADEARNLLQTALPVMRDAFLPGQVDRAAAERLATQLGM